MNSLLAIPIQKLFVVTIFLKVLSSGIGWAIGDPWGFGFALPLAIMGVYILMGIKRKNSDVPDEKFADTCYYLGFIFTISSIIFSLFDLPNIGTKLQDIAVRFGAAMVSTVLGLVVRVYLVSFKQELADAVAAAEDSVVEASHKFREQLVIAFEKLREFELQVDGAARGTVESVNLQIEALSKSYGDKLMVFFKELAEENREASIKALDEVKEASLRLSRSVDDYSNSLRANLMGIEDKVATFAQAVTDRLKATTFPDDYFSQNLAEPVSQLRKSTLAISASVNDATTEVKESVAVLTASLKSLRTKATTANLALDRVSQIAETQERILDGADAQLNALSGLSNTIQRFDGTLETIVGKLGEHAGVISTLMERADGILTNNAEATKHVAAIRGQLNSSAEQAKHVVAAVEGIAREITAFGENLTKQRINISQPEPLLPSQEVSDIKQEARNEGEAGLHAHEETLVMRNS